MSRYNRSLSGGGPPRRSSGPRHHHYGASSTSLPVPPRKGLAYVSYEDDQVWRIQPIDYEKTITLHKSNPRNDRFLQGRGLKVHDEVEYDRGITGAGSGVGAGGHVLSGSAADDGGSSTVTLKEIPQNTIRNTGSASCQLLTGVVARIANNKFGFIQFQSPPHAVGDIFFQLGGCVNAYQTFDQLRPGVEVNCLVVDSMNQPDKQVAVYVHTTGRILDPPLSTGPNGNSSAIAKQQQLEGGASTPTIAPSQTNSADSRFRDRERERDPDQLRERGNIRRGEVTRANSTSALDNRQLSAMSDHGSTSSSYRDVYAGNRNRDVANRPGFGASRQQRPDEELFGWVVYLGRDEGSFRGIHSPVEHKFSLVPDNLAGDRAKGAGGSDGPVQLPVPVGSYPGIRVGDEVSCRLYVPPSGTSLLASKSILGTEHADVPLVYQLERMSSRDPVFTSTKTWSYGRIATLDEQSGRGVIVDDDTHTGERVEIQRNLIAGADRNTIRNLRERDNVQYLRMTYVTRLGHVRTVAALVQEDLTGGPSSPSRSNIHGRYNAASGTAPGPYGPPSPVGTERDAYNDRNSGVRSANVFDMGQRSSSPVSFNRGNEDTSNYSTHKGWITSLQDSFGILRLQGDRKTYFFHFKQAVRFEDLKKFDCITCQLKPDNTATNVEKLSYRLPSAPPDWRRGEVAELEASLGGTQSSSPPSTTMGPGVGGLLRDSETGETFEFKVHAVRDRQTLRVHDQVLFLLVDSPKYGNNFVAMVDAGGSTDSRGQPSDGSNNASRGNRVLASKGVMEGWVTSLQDSFGILRLIGDRETHFFHIKNCLSPFNELRNGDCIRCTLKADGTAQHVEKLTYQLPLDPPDWSAGHIVQMDESSGTLMDRNSQRKFDFKGSVLKGSLQEGDGILYLIVDSPKYGNDFVAAIVPDQVYTSASKRNVRAGEVSETNTSTDRHHEDAAQDQREDGQMHGWVVSIKGNRGLFRATDDPGEWEFDVERDGPPDLMEGQEVSCNRDEEASSRNEYRVKGLQLLPEGEPPLAREGIWRKGKIGSAKEDHGWLVDNDNNATVPIQRNQLAKDGWKDGQIVVYLPMATEDGDVAALVEDDPESETPGHKRKRSDEVEEEPAKSSRQE